MEYIVNTTNRFFIEHRATASSQTPKRELLNALLVHMAGKNKGGIALAKVFLWLKKGGPCIKTAVTSAVEREWKSVFLENEQKEKIETGEEPKMLDMQLLYFLLQNRCGLAESWEVWDTPGDTLEHLIGLVHYGLPMGTKERLVKYEEHVFEMLQKAASLSGTDPITLGDTLTEIRQCFGHIKEMLDRSKGYC